MDVLGLGGKTPGGVQGDEPGIAHGPHGFQHACLLEGLVQIRTWLTDARWCGTHFTSN
jgi:hypothetical protein